jgi:hypothetical protein
VNTTNAVITEHRDSEINTTLDMPKECSSQCAGKHKSMVWTHPWYLEITRLYLSDAIQQKQERNKVHKEKDNTRSRSSK